MFKSDSWVTRISDAPIRIVTWTAIVTACEKGPKFFALLKMLPLYDYEAMAWEPYHNDMHFSQFFVFSKCDQHTLFVFTHRQ